MVVVASTRIEREEITSGSEVGNKYSSTMEEAVGMVLVRTVGISGNDDMVV